MTKEEIKALVCEKMSSKRIVLFGAGVVAEEFYEAHKDKLNISHCVSNFQREWGEGAFMEGELDVRQYRPEDIEENDYIIVCGPLAFRSVELQLRGDGYKMYEHFVESQIGAALYSGKKIALFYGQCILRDIYKCITQVESFNREYASIFTQTKNGQTIVVNRVVYYSKYICDLYIHTPKLLDRDSVYVVNEDELPESCIKISIGNLSAPIYWPQVNFDRMIYNERYVIPYNIKRNLDYYHTLYRRDDLNVTRMILDGFATKDIIKCLSAEDYYSEEDVKKNLRFTLKSLKIAERGIDIKIAEYVNENYKKEMLYQNFLHPNKCIIWYYVRGIQERIGLCCDEISDLEEKSVKHIHESGDVPIYPSVAKHLELEFFEKDYKYEVMTGRGVALMTFTEFMEHYIEYTRKTMEIIKMW